MKVKLSKNTYVRIYDDGELGYITNQLTRHDAMFNNSGAAFLSVLSREPQEELDLANEVCKMYEDADPREIYADFVDMMMILEDAKFVLRSESESDIDSKDIDFSYSLVNPKELAKDFDQRFKQLHNYSPTEGFAFRHDSKNPRITVIQFELTSKCNERCIHCYIPNPKKNHGINMPVGKVKSILDEFASMGGFAVTLSGGEALLHKDLIEILRHCRKNDLQITLLSNLISLDEELILALKETNVALVQTSLYSMDPEIHDYITTIKGSFDKTKDAIERLVAADIPVQVSCPVMKANRLGYKDVLKYAQSKGIKAQTDFIMMARADLDTDNLANRISIEETEELLRDIIKYDKDYTAMRQELNPLTSDQDEFLDGPMCGAGLNDICVAANGDLYPCAGWQSFVVGNVYKQSLKEVWESSEKIQQIRNVTRRDFPQCIECEAADYCAMCMVRNYNENGGDMFKVNDHFCKVAHLNKRLVEEAREQSND
ncbi:radical SAM protein [uncultured Duncaniella sp.]|uniref:radical SAM/SPASM domain-containing protein n=1 Tax=uncultured Duncaniella sp. TaxID=2768039 RepID=UPI0026483CA9|nr:radical SAM protein [uncultured Duncaniella sp.]